jgi:hypothetical protein
MRSERFSWLSNGANDMTDFDQLKQDLEAAKRWFPPGGIKLDSLTLEQAKELEQLAAKFSSAAVAFRIGVASYAAKRQNSN